MIIRETPVLFTGDYLDEILYFIPLLSFYRLVNYLHGHHQENHAFYCVAIRVDCVTAIQHQLQFFKFYFAKNRSASAFLLRIKPFKVFPPAVVYLEINQSLIVSEFAFLLIKENKVSEPPVL